MNSLIYLPFLFASFGIFNMSVALCAIVLALAVVLAILKYVIRVKVVYIDSDDGSVISVEKYFWLARAPIYPARCDGKKFIGWSLTGDGSDIIRKKRMLVGKNIYLYSVWGPEEKVAVEDKEVGNKTLTINLHYDSLEQGGLVELGIKDVPETTVKDEEIVFDVDLYGVFKEEKTSEEPVEEVVEEPVVEEVAEETVEEPVEEAVEEPVEEVAEEPVEEVVEEPVQEVVEEPIEEAVEEPAEEVIEEPVVEVMEEPAQEVAEVAPTYLNNGESYNSLDIRYSRSFTANLIQGNDTLRDYYNDIKNYILSYKGVKSRISWKYDSYNRGRDQLFKIKLRGKTVCLYCALNPDDFDVSKYHHESIDAKIFVDVPMLVKIKSNLGLRKAKEIVDAVMARFGIEKSDKIKTVDYLSKYPYQTNEELLAVNLIKEIGVGNSTFVKNDTEEVAEEPVAEVAEEAIEEPVAEEVAEEAIEEPVVEEVAEEAIEEPVAEEVVEETVEEPVVEEVAEEAIEEPVVEEVAEEAIEEPVVEEVVEETVEEPVQETVEEIAEEPETENNGEEVFNESVVQETEDEPGEESVVEEAVEEINEENIETVEETDHSISAEEADALISDDEIESMGEDVEFITKNDTKKEIINIDTISNSFEAGDVVCLESLKKKKLISKNAKSVKVLARGHIDKPLTIKAGEFSKIALKMIMLTGGTAIHSTYKVK